MSNESYLGQVLDEGKIRPLAGHLIAEKLVTQDYTSPSGVIIPRFDKPEDELTKHNLLVVRALGKPPDKWHTRYFQWEYDHDTTWAEQGIEVGTVVVARAVAGVGQSSDSPYVQLRYDEIAAIGAAADDDRADMYPAPGWVMMVQDVDHGDTSAGGIYVGSERAEVFAEGALVWGVVTMLAKWDPMTRGTLVIGDRIGVPRYNPTEFIQLEGGIRLVPFDDVLVIEES